MIDNILKAKITGQEYDQNNYQTLSIKLNNIKEFKTDAIHIKVDNVRLTIDVTTDGTLRVFARGPYKIVPEFPETLLESSFFSVESVEE